MAREAVRDGLAAANPRPPQRTRSRHFQADARSRSTRCPPSHAARTRSKSSAKPSSTSPCAASFYRRPREQNPASELLANIARGKAERKRKTG